MARLPPNDRRIRRVLHPSDFSSLSEHAFGEALRWARADRAELLLLHVVIPVAPIIGDEYVSSPWLYPQISRALHEGAMETLRRLVARARAHGVRGEALVLHGEPAAQIVHAAESREVGLIVMGSRGRTGFLRWLLGSLAEDVVAKAPCPVLVVGASMLRHESARRHLAVLRGEGSRRANDGAEDGASVETLDRPRGAGSMRASRRTESAHAGLTPHRSDPIS
ncbi:MAG TPA: universal stress protein [Methylomirabilota bacterium]|jgi:nucleotide-binding universal stress UspA family protein